jgi:hypothetical protein
MGTCLFSVRATQGADELTTSEGNVLERGERHK